ncbi:hypothetical protein ACFL03_11660 [Thermodesulfobacteriota bacterium]
MLKNFFKDKFFWITAIVGLVFMLLTLHFDINPVEASVVPVSIQGTGFHIFLYNYQYACMDCRDYNK